MSVSLWHRLILGIIAAALLGAAACGDGDGDKGGGQAELRAVTTLELFADLVRRVGGERVEVGALFPSGADAHTFELSPGAVRDVAEADIVFLNGLGLEAAAGEGFRNNASGPVVELSEGLPAIDGNPHLWLDPQLAAGYVERIRDELSALDPEGAATYDVNAAAYLSELEALDRETAAALESIAPERRKLVTFHDAFPYLAARYGLEVVAVVVPSPGQEPSARAVAELSETLASEDVPAVFREPQFGSDVLEQAASDAGVEVRELLSDAFTEEVDSYVDLMRFNAQQLVEGLGGD